MKVSNIPSSSNNVGLTYEYDYDEQIILITPSGVSLRDVTLDNVIARYPSEMYKLILKSFKNRIWSYKRSGGDGY